MSGGDAARLIRVYGAWIVLVTAVVIAAAIGVSLAAPREYRSGAIVVVESRVKANTTPVPPDMGTEKEIARSGLVVEPAARLLGVPASVLLDGLSIDVAPDANVLTFTVTNPNPVTAQAYAEALAQAYVSYRNSGESGGSSTSTQHATLVTEAELPSAPAGRSFWINVAAGLVVGLLLGVGTALIRDRMSDRIRGRADFERVSGATVLAAVPKTRRRRGAEASRPIILSAPQSPAAESFRYLRSRLQPLLRGRATVLVTSAGEHEGRTVTATNLAAAMAQAGLRVVLVDADLRNPRVHAAFDVDNAVGLTNVLAGERTAGTALQDTRVARLRVLAAGEPTQNAGDMLVGNRLRRILDSLRAQCDLIVMDSSPVLSVSDTIALAAASDHILLVGDYRRTTRTYVARALDELGEVVHGNVSGVLLNAPRSAGGLTPDGRSQPAGAPTVQQDAAQPAPVQASGGTAPAAVGSAAVGSAAVGSAAVGSAAVGSAAVGSASVPARKPAGVPGENAPAVPGGKPAGVPGEHAPAVPGGKPAEAAGKNSPAVSDGKPVGVPGENPPAAPGGQQSGGSGEHPAAVSGGAPAAAPGGRPAEAPAENSASGPGGQPAAEEPAAAPDAKALASNVYSSASASAPAMAAHDGDDIEHRSDPDLPVQPGELRRRLTPPGLTRLTFPG